MDIAMKVIRNGSRICELPNRMLSGYSARIHAAGTATLTPHAAPAAFHKNGIATALTNAAIGEGVRVRNLSSGKEIQAWVIDKGEVETRF